LQGTQASVTMFSGPIRFDHNFLHTVDLEELLEASVNCDILTGGISLVKQRLIKV